MFCPMIFVNARRAEGISFPDVSLSRSKYSVGFCVAAVLGLWATTIMSYCDGHSIAAWIILLRSEGASPSLNNLSFMCVSPLGLGAAKSGSPHNLITHLLGIFSP